MRSYCCHIPIQQPPFTGCSRDAEWHITHGNSPDDYTESCTEHVGDMLTDAALHEVTRIVSKTPKED